MSIRWSRCDPNDWMRDEQRDADRAPLYPEVHWPEPRPDPAEYLDDER